jgi:hypothetical protein
MKKLYLLVVCCLCCIVTKAQDSIFQYGFDYVYRLNHFYNCNMQPISGPDTYIDFYAPGKSFTITAIGEGGGGDEKQAGSGGYLPFRPTYAIPQTSPDNPSVPVMYFSPREGGYPGQWGAHFDLEDDGCVFEYFDITYTAGIFAIGNNNHSSFYCESETLGLSVPGWYTQYYPGDPRTEEMQWQMGNDPGNLMIINNSTHSGLNFTIDDIRKLGFDPYKPMYFNCTGIQLGDLRNVHAAVVGPFQFVKEPPTPTLTTTAPTCPGDKATIVLSDFKYPDGSSYTGFPSYDISFKGLTDGIVYNDSIYAGALQKTLQVPGGQAYAVVIEGKEATCAINLTSPVIPAAPAPIVVTPVASCSNGAPLITVNATGGTPGYTYSTDGSAGIANNTFAGLNAGTGYTFYVTDSKGCGSSAPLTTKPLLTVTQTAKSDPTSAGNFDGYIQVAGNGGSGAPYTYSLDNNTYQSSNEFDGLAQGAYTIYVRDQAGCVCPTTLSVTLKDPVPLAVTAAVTDISCNGLSDGSVTVDVSGGVPPYTYSADGNTYLSINQFYNLAANSYTFYAKDNKGNTGNTLVTVHMPDALTIGVTDQHNVLCKNEASGQITVAASGGTGGASAYQYALNNGGYGSAASFTVAAGNYTVTVKDANGCHVTTPSVTISEPAQAVSLTVAPQDAACNGASNGTIKVTAQNGAQPYTYSAGGPAQSSPAQSDPLITGLPAGTYTVLVTDNNGCQASQANVVVGEPAVLQLSQQSETDAACYGAASGSVTVVAAGGTGNVRFSLNGVSNSNGVFNGLAAGNYTVTATDDNHCTASLPVTISQPTTLNLQSTVTDATCNGKATGQVQLKASGGTAPYSWSDNNITYNNGGGNNSYTFSTLAAGNYTYYAKDANGCIASTGATVAQPIAITVSYTVADALCNGDATGAITVTPSGGVGPYTFNADGAPFQNANLLSGIGAGTHSISVMDAQGCVKTESNVLVGEPAALTLQLSNQLPVSCFNGADGAVTVQAGGGTSPYTFALDNGAYQSASNFTQLAANNYTVTVKDANGCLNNAPATVIQPAQLSLQINKTDILCAGDATGSISLQAAGGVGNYTYALDNSALQTLGSYSNLPAGSYNIHVKDGNQCTGDFPVTLVNLYAPLTATLSAVDPTTCTDKGSITVTAVQGGLAPYNYSLDNQSYTNSPVFNNLFSGSYTVYVKDNNGCVINQSISASGPTSIQGALQTTPALCKGSNNGSITITSASGGNNQYEYSLDGVNYQSSAQFTQLAAGTYQVYVRDVPYSCQTVLTGIVTEPALLNISLVNNEPVSCYGLSNGQVKLQASGGISNQYTFQLESAQNDNLKGAQNDNGVFTSLAAGTYNATVTDNNGCSTNIPVTVTQPALLTLNTTAIKAISCNGLKDGEADLTAAGGITPYSYAIDGGSYQSNATITSLNGGSYLFNVKDNNGCIQQLSANIDEPDALTLAVTNAANILCSGASTGEITVNASGGTGAYSFVLNNLPAQSGRTFNHLPVGSYLLSVTDNNNCAAHQTVTLTQPDPLQLSHQVTQPTCGDKPDGSINVDVTGGVAPYTYSWNTGATENAITNAGGGTYTVTVTDANACQLADSALLVQPAGMALDLGFQDTVLCVGQTIELSAGNPGNQYRWSADNGFTSNEQIVTISKDGNYQLTVTSPGGCTASANFHVQTSASVLTADFLLSSAGVVGDTVFVLDTSTPIPTSHTWTFPEGIRDAGSSADGSIHEIVFEQPGDYTVKMLVGLGECADEISKTIRILEAGQQSTTDSLLGYHKPEILTYSAYPNPTSGDFKVKVGLSKPDNVRLQLISFNTGAILQNQSGEGMASYEFAFSAAGLTQGIYLVSIQVGEEYQVVRILKI